MPRLLDETMRANRQLLAALLVGFLAGFLLVLTPVGWLARDEWAKRGWWLLPDLVQFMVAAFCFGCVTAWAALTWVGRRQHRLAMYRCPMCNRVLPYGDEPCACDAEGRARYRRKQQLPNRMLRHYRRRVPWVLLTYLLVLPIAWHVVTRSGRPMTLPFALDLAATHGVFCALVAVVTRVVELSDFTRRGKRLARRLAPYVQLLSLWPLAVCAVMLVYTALTGS
jgi:hypothetical protein